MPAKKREKTKYTKTELKKFDKIIDQKLEQAQDQLDYYLNQIKELAHNEDAKVKGLNDGLGTVESERLHNMASRQKKLVQHLNNAKLRIQNDAYGTCRVSGKLISAERLKAVPHATLSIEAKQKSR